MQCNKNHSSSRPHSSWVQGFPNRSHVAAMQQPEGRQCTDTCFAALEPEKAQRSAAHLFRILYSTTSAINRICMACCYAEIDRDWQRTTRTCDIGVERCLLPVFAGGTLPLDTCCLCLGSGRQSPHCRLRPLHGCCRLWLCCLLLHEALHQCPGRRNSSMSCETSQTR